MELLTGVINYNVNENNCVSYINNQNPTSQLFLTKVSNLMNNEPFCLHQEQSLDEGLRAMNDKLVWVCPVINNEKKLHGIFHMQWALKSFLKFNS